MKVLEKGTKLKLRPKVDIAEIEVMWPAGQMGMKEPHYTVNLAGKSIGRLSHHQMEYLFEILDDTPATMEELKRGFSTAGETKRVKAKTESRKGDK